MFTQKFNRTVLRTTDPLSLSAYKAAHFVFSVMLFLLFWIKFRYTSFSRIIITKALRYDIYASLVYASLLFLFSKVYNVYLLGYLRIRQLVLFQLISQTFSAAIVIVIASVAWFKFSPVSVFIPMLAIYAAIDAVWSYTASYMYYKKSPQQKAVVLYGDDDGEVLDLDITGKPVERLISIEEEIFCSKDNIYEVMELLREYDTFFAMELSPQCTDILLKYCVDEGKDGFFIPSSGEIILQSAYHIQSFHEPVLSIGRKKNSIEYLTLKRAFDIFASALGIIILSPLMLITATAIKAYDGGPAIYKQTRLTLNGREFTIYKFRSMHVNAEHDGKAVLSSGKTDSRITPVGKLIRAVRLDELPQLFNILFGDMSIVGPRPERPEIAEQYYEELPEFRLRLQVKAGLTGYAQVYGKYNTSPKQKLKFDLMYINKMGILTDIMLMFATLGILFSKESTEGVEVGQTTAILNEYTEKDV